ncbi:MAG: OmpH family outer membrane protein [Verrucomicrobiota bacterium]
MKSFRDLMLEEIGKIATEIAKKKGATILLDKSGPSLIGISNLIYFDPSYDITEEVLKEINKGRPAGSAAAKPAASTATETKSEDKPLFVMPK